MNVDLVVRHEQEQVEPTALYELHAVLGLLHIEGGILKVSKPLFSLVMFKACEHVESMQNINITIAQTQNMVSSRFCQAVKVKVAAFPVKLLNSPRFAVLNGTFSSIQGTDWAHFEKDTLKC